MNELVKHIEAINVKSKEWMDEGVWNAVLKRAQWMKKAHDLVLVAVNELPNPRKKGKSIKKKAERKNKQIQKKGY